MVMVGAGKLCVFANSKRKMIPKTFQLACNLAIQTFEAEWNDDKGRKIPSLQSINVKSTSLFY